MKCLVLGPGAMGIYSLLGYLKSIEERIDLYTEISGSSAGSILTGLLAMGFTIDQMIDMLVSLDTKFFLRSFTIKNVLTRYGGIRYSDFRDLFIATTGSDPQLKDLKKKIYISSYNLQYSRIEYFSQDTHPLMHLTEALFKSISIPFMFESYDMYIDAGIHEELPLGPFIDRSSDDVHIVQLIFEDENKDISGLLDFSVRVIASLFKNIQRYPMFTNRKIIRVTTQECFNFNMELDDKIRLYIKGF